MSGEKWTQKQLDKLQTIVDNKPQYITDNQLAGTLTRQFGKSNEAIRWQIRQMRRYSALNVPPKILILDIETLPIEALVWGTRKQYIYMEQVEKDWSVLSWAAKWLFDKKVMGGSVTAEEAIDHRDNSVLPDIWNLMNEAHVVVTHNGDRFDIKRLNSRFLVNDFPKPMYFKSVDTWKIAIDNFDLTYNKLDWIASILGIGRKVETEFEWWAECHKGNQKYLDMMLKYNKWDVNLEEEAYLKLRPWMAGHPNMNVHSVGNVTICPTCGGADLHWNGTYSTPLGLYKAFRCQDCGAIGRSTKKQYKLNSSVVQ